MGNFSGQLNSNEIFSALYNMIISQQVFADNLAGTHSELVDAARVDGTLYGDTKLYYSTDVLSSSEWGNDAEAANLLQLHRPNAPECQKITLDKFRQICLTVDNYLSKRAWSTEGAFSDFNSVMLGWIRDTKKVYDCTLYNTYIGTAKGAANVNEIDVPVAAAIAGMAATDVEGKNRVEVETVAQAIADLVVAMGDVSRDYNDYKQLRSYAAADLKLVWNAKHINKFRKIDLPTIFHKDGLEDKFDQYTLPARYFGRDVASTDKGEGKVIGADGIVDATKGSVRSRVEKIFTFAGEAVHFFPGDLLVSGMQVDGAGHPDFTENEVYIEDADVICKVFVKLPPFMSAFEVGTSFFNPKSLTENHYLTWGFNTLEYLKNYPLITVKKA